jgi:hypothetical protein
MSPPKYLDLVVLIAALAVFLLAGLPMVGFAAAAGAWLAQRGIQILADRRVEAELKSGNRQRAMAMIAGSGLGRVWLMATAVLLTGLLAENEDGLAAALLLALLFTVSFAAQGLARLFQAEAGQGPQTTRGQLS